MAFPVPLHASGTKRDATGSHARRNKPQNSPPPPSVTSHQTRANSNDLLINPPRRRRRPGVGGGGGGAEPGRPERQLKRIFAAGDRGSGCGAAGTILARRKCRACRLTHSAGGSGSRIGAGGTAAEVNPPQIASYSRMLTRECRDKFRVLRSAMRGCP